MQENRKKARSKISQSEQLQQERHDARREYKVSRGWFRIVLFLFIGTVFYILFFSDFMRITTTAVTGTNVLTEAEIKQVMQAELDDKLLGVIPRNTFPFVVPQLIEQKLTETFRRIDSVEVKSVFPNTLTATITEHDAVLVWCRDHGKTDCYMIDRNGATYERVDWSSPDIVQNDQVTIIDEKGYDVLLNDTVLSPEYVDQLMHVRGAMGRASGILFDDDILVPSRISNEARLTTQEGWYILVGLDHSLEKTERTVTTFFDKTAFDKPREELEYVDVRIGEKVFYRFKGDPVESDDEESSEEAQKEGKEMINDDGEDASKKE